MNEITRLIEPSIADNLTYLPAIAIDGPKAVGKTWIAKRLARSVFEFDKEATRELYRADNGIITTAEKPTLIDEWQKAPDTWDTVRRAVDEELTPGQFLLTGSAYPKSAQVHSGAGRIVHFRLHPLSIQERLGVTPCVSIDKLLNGVESVEDANTTTDIRLEWYIQEIFRSGFPGIWNADKRAWPLLIDGYIENILNKETEENGYTIRRPDTLRNWLTAFASATGTDAGYTEILDRATPGVSSKPAKSTTVSFRDMLKNLWLLEELQPWLPTVGNFNRLKMTPKHYLTDPAIEAALLGLSYDLVMSGDASSGFDEKHGSITGRLFESLIALSLRTYSVAAGAKLNYVRTLDAQREVDFVVSKGSKVIGIEVKLSSSVGDGDVKHLNWLHDTYGSNLVAKIIVTTGDRMYIRKQDGVIVCPAALLGA